MSARTTLLELIETPQAFTKDAAEVEALQLEAAREIFGLQRGRIAVLDRRAREAGVESVREFRDLVPLLFAHTTYKSYPQSFIEQGRWDRLRQWLQTLCAADLRGVDVAGVQTIDEWIARLHAAGHRVLATSGSSGKVSFLCQSVADVERKKRHFARTIAWPWLAPGAQQRPFFSIGPQRGFNSAIEASNLLADIFGRHGDVHFLTEEPLLIQDLSRAAALRTRMAEGTAQPSEIEAMERGAAEKARRMDSALEELAAKIVARRHEPIYLSALWAQHLMIIERARRLGVGDGEFHRDSIVAAGGGIKGVALPPDYKERVSRFYGDVVRPGGYGMTEMAQRWPMCEQRRYHRPPGLILLLLDRPGERLLGAADGAGGLVEGRFAFLDLVFEARWGGLISGDKVTVDFSPRCPCGRSGPTLLDTIERYATQGEADHIGCAGTIDAYVRGAIGE